MCPFSRTIWCESPWQIDILRFSTESMEVWIQKVCHPHRFIGIELEDQHKFQFFAANAIDMVWMARNSVVHQGIPCVMQGLVSRVGKISREHWIAWQSKSLSAKEQCIWKHPPPGKIKVNVDVAV